MKILFVASEGLPYSKTGGLADVVGALPKALLDAGHDVMVLLPRYRNNKIDSVAVPNLTVSAAHNGLRFPSIAQAASVNGVKFFFADDPSYFDREQLYGEKGVDYPDNGERFTEFARVAIEFTKRVWMPDVIHCHDWQSSMVPVLLRISYAQDPSVAKLPVVFTIHNLGYQGLFPQSILDQAGLPASLFAMDALEYYGKVNFLKGGLVFADALSTVSRKYAQEIQTPEYGHGLEGVIRNRARDLTGILNGVDYSAWSPEADKLIAANYSPENLEGKKTCKKNLLEVFKLPVQNLSRPLIGIVSRFDEQKGFDLIEAIAADLMREELSMVVLGTGKPQYEKFFTALAVKFPSKIGVQIAYDNVVAHKIEAGADMFLMPSRYEPCGLNQIYSLKYGTVPVVRATGGLDDTISAYSPQNPSGTGFKFETYDSQSLLKCLQYALQTFRDQRAWRNIQAAGMAKDFSWRQSAAAYADLYQRAAASRIQRARASSN
jgi:starch synthase